MKETFQSGSPKKEIKKSSPANLFLNSIIILLAILVLFMGYSLYSKVEGIFKNNSEEDITKDISIIQVEVLNGCGVSGIAEKFTNYLRQNNFDVVQIGNYFSFNIDKSLVIDRTGEITKAKKVAEILGIDHSQVIQQKNDDYFLDVSVIIGKDFNNLKFNK